MSGIRARIDRLTERLVTRAERREDPLLRRILEDAEAFDLVLTLNSRRDGFLQETDLSDEEIIARLEKRLKALGWGATPITEIPHEQA